MRNSYTEFDEPDTEYPRGTPGWWIALWLSWGVTVATIVYYFDRSLAASGIWMFIALINATFCYQLLRPFVISMIDYYSDRHESDTEYMLEFEGRGDTDSFEDEALIAQQTEVAIPVAMYVGAFHGYLVGGVGGALANCDGYFVGVPSSVTTACGVLVGVLLLPIQYGIITALIWPRDKTESLLQTARRRFGLLVSPVFAVAHIMAVRN